MSIEQQTAGQKEISLSTIHLFITEECNLSCRHCFVQKKKGGGQKQQLSYWETLKILEQAFQCGVKRVVFLGGEPFLHPSFLKILGHLSHLPVSIGISTNGFFVNDRILAVLKKLGKKVDVAFSLDGDTAKTHDAMRGAGSFEITVRNLIEMKKHQVNCQINTVITRYNFKSIEGLASLAEKLGIKTITLLHFVSSDPKQRKEFELGTEEHKWLFKFMSDKIHSGWKGMDIVSGPLAAGMRRIAKFFAGEKIEKRGELFFCNAGSKSCAVKSNGDVLPCGLFWDYVLGNVKEHLLKEILTTSPALRKLRALREIKLKKESDCQKCNFTAYCDGGCRALAYARTGALTAKRGFFCA
ncbi:MAG: radical SAM protein [Candidatus Saganbacteria bacterium]|nr:radical SAM protein [Candidatus Saganbacteria bacterium]